MTAFSVAARSPAQVAGSHHQNRVVAALTSTRWMACGFGLAAAAIAYFLLPAELGRSIYNPMGAGAAVALLTGAGRVASARAWRLLATAVLSHAAADALGSAVPVADHGALGVAAGVIYLFSYLVLAVGLARMLTALRSR